MSSSPCRSVWLRRFSALGVLGPRGLVLGILSALAALSTGASAQVVVHRDFASYDAAVGGDHSIFLDFETDADGDVLTPSENVNGDLFFDVEGDAFSDDVTYSSPDDLTSRVNFANILGGGVQNEIGPFPSWNGTLRWDYAQEVVATAFTGVEVSVGTQIRLYRAGALVGSTAFGSFDSFAFFGFTSAEPFDRVEIAGLFYAIDAHYSTYDVSTVSIDFDDRPGWMGSQARGTPFGSDFLIDNEYASLGVLFDSRGGGLVVVDDPLAPSAPNVVNATDIGPSYLNDMGPRISYSWCSEALFWKDDRPGVVDSFSVTTTAHGGGARLVAYDYTGAQVASAQGGNGIPMRIDAPGRIHRVDIEQGPLSFDDVSFSGFQPVDVLALSPASPGAAGGRNRVVVTGAEPFEPVLVVLATGDVRGRSAGPAQLLAPTILRADASGRAELPFRLPAAMSGVMLSGRVVTASGEASPWSTNVIAPPEQGPAGLARSPARQAR